MAILSDAPPRIRWRRLAAYYALACGISWSWWIPLALRGDVTRAGLAWPTHLPGLLGPAIAAVVVTAATGGRAGLAELWRRVTRWRVAWWWYAIVAGTAAMALLAFVAAWVTGSEPPSASDFGTYSGVGSMPLALMVAYVLIVNGWGEEIGWRGFMAQEMLRTRGPLAAGLMTALPWALWHAPLFWIVASFRSFGVAGTVGWALGLACGSVVLVAMYSGTRGSILIAALWHTAFNLTSATAAAEGLPAAVSSTLVMIAVVVLVVLAARSRFRRRAATDG